MKKCFKLGSLVRFEGHFGAFGVICGFLKKEGGTRRARIYWFDLQEVTETALDADDVIFLA